MMMIPVTCLTKFLGSKRPTGNTDVSCAFKWQLEATATVIKLFFDLLEAILSDACSACAGQANQARSTSVFNLP